jgi:flagellar motor switch protein FliN/FliY
MSAEQAHQGRTPPASAQVINLGDLHEAAHRGSQTALIHSDNPLHAVRTRLNVCVGDAELTVGELMSAKEHQVLVLDRGLEDPVDLVLEGKVVARGQLVAVDGHFALRITELPVALKV